MGLLIRLPQTSRNLDFDLCTFVQNWPPRSPDLNPLDFYFYFWLKIRNFDNFTADLFLKFSSRCVH